jgi:hypothetical protein
MDPERPEVYERIPWETLEQKGSQKQWLAYAVAAAVTLGALAYTFTRNQPLPVPDPVASGTTIAPAPAATPSSAPPSTATPTVPSPLVVAEADLYAVDPERLFEQASAHAEWVAVEYMSMDGSDQSRQTLAGLLPQGAPLPTAGEGVQVLADWVGSRSLTQTGPTTFRVEVVVRSIASSAESGFTRQPPRLVVIEVEIGEDGVPRVTDVPELRPMPATTPADLTLDVVPDDVVAELRDVELVGGHLGADGNWEVVVQETGADGVTRPVLIRP